MITKDNRKPSIEPAEVQGVMKSSVLFDDLLHGWRHRLAAKPGLGGNDAAMPLTIPDWLMLFCERLGCCWPWGRG
eukprot:4843844-Pyramimonas_sp.AAC.1